MTTTAELMAPVTDLVPHLRWRVGPAQAGELPGSALIDDPDNLAAQVAATAEGRGSTDPQVLGSLWWQAYAYRVAGTTLAAWLLSGAAPDPAASAGTAVGLARSRPALVVYGADVEAVTHVSALGQRLFGEHLDPLAVSLRRRHQLGEALLWGNVAAGVASALGAVGSAASSAPGGAYPQLYERIEELTATLPHGLATLGSWISTGGHPAFRRRSCCLWWKTTASGGAYCEDCSLLPEGPT
jgi:iron complex transport system ATP-binding protein